MSVTYVAELTPDSNVHRFITKLPTYTINMPYPRYAITCRWLRFLHTQGLVTKFNEHPGINKVYRRDKGSSVRIPDLDVTADDKAIFKAFVLRLGLGLFFEVTNFTVALQKDFVTPVVWGPTLQEGISAFREKRS